MLKELIWPVALQVVGVVVIIAEFLLPSAGILAVTALGVFGFSLYLVFAHISMSAGMTFVAIDVILLPFIVAFGIKVLAASPATLRTALDSKEGTVSQPQEWSKLVGLTGETITILRPAGAALIQGRRIDVVSRGEFIEKGMPIEVINVDGNRIVVKRRVDSSQ
jgi:membrane-bound ClpP family serine protease